MEQISIFDLYDMPEEEHHRCIECGNCKPTGNFKPYIDKNGLSHFIAFCNPTRQVITEHTASWLCKNQHYERR